MREPMTPDDAIERAAQAWSADDGFGDLALLQMRAHIEHTNTGDREWAIIEAALIDLQIRSMTAGQQVASSEDQASFRKAIVGLIQQRDALGNDPEFERAVVSVIEQVRK
jgi:hypothetical protein